MLKMQSTRTEGDANSSVSPDTNRRGPQYTTDYRRPGGPSPPPAPRRRLGGFGSGGSADLSSLPCGTGG